MQMNIFLLPYIDLIVPVFTCVFVGREQSVRRESLGASLHPLLLRAVTRFITSSALELI